MLKSLYDGAAAMHVIHRQHEQTSTNIANLNTGGFRRAILAVKNQSATYIPGNVGSGPELEGRHTDYSQGRLIDSRRALDFAISGDAFFTLRNGDGSVLYTKDGRFFRNHESGELVTDDGLPVLGEEGTIKIPKDISDSQISVGPDGTVVANENNFGKLLLTSFQDNETLIPIGQTNFGAGPGTLEADVDAQIRQFYHEVSNVNPTGELISLIIGGRHYEAIQKATRAISESLQQSIRG